MILALDPDSESDLQLFGDSGTRFRSDKNQNCSAYTSDVIPVLDPDPESDFQPHGGDSRYGFRSSTKWNHNTSSGNDDAADDEVEAVLPDVVQGVSCVDTLPLHHLDDGQGVEKGTSWATFGSFYS